MYGFVARAQGGNLAQLSRPHKQHLNSQMHSGNEKRRPPLRYGHAAFCCRCCVASNAHNNSKQGVKMKVLRVLSLSVVIALAGCAASYTTPGGSVQISQIAHSDIGELI